MDMEVRETLDFNVRLDEGRALGDYRVAGEVAIQIREPINPLELAPLRICARRPADAQWVANPAVVVLDASLTAATADGREWYRFVRPDLFAHVEAPQRVLVFKYESTSTSPGRAMPVLILPIVSGAADGAGCAMMVMCEPNPDGLFAGCTMEAPAVLLSLAGQITSQASRPTAVWFRERNSLLWHLDDMPIPRRAETSRDELASMIRSLAVKIQGAGVGLGPLALRFTARGASVVDSVLAIVRVAPGSQMATHPVVDGPASRTISSGRCIYLPTRDSNLERHDEEESSGESASESTSDPSRDNNSRSQSPSSSSLSLSETTPPSDS